MNKGHQVACIIIHFGSMHPTVCALRSALNGGVSHVTIVDNSDSFDIDLADYDCPRCQVVILKPKENLGFANGVNYALDFCFDCKLYSHVLLLNNDAVLMDGSLMRMLQSCIKNSAVTGYALTSSGSRIPLASSLSKSNLFCREIKNTSQLNRRDKSWLSAACLLINSNYDRIPRFNPDFFMYWEDAEYCWRLKNEYGYELILIDHDVCVHTPGTSSVNKVALRYSWHLDGTIRYLNLIGHNHVHTSLIIIIKYMIISIRLKSLFLFSKSLLYF